MYMNGMDDALLSRRKKGGGGFLPSLCNILGVLILMAVLALCLALTLPRFLGYGIYNVVSGSMEPVYPVGSMIYVKAAQPQEVEVGDPITFYLDEGLVATHRVIEVNREEQYFRTKGDANNAEDGSPVLYANLIGKPMFCVPQLGNLSHWISQPPGTYIAICCALCLLVLMFLPDVLDAADAADKKAAEKREKSE